MTEDKILAAISSTAECDFSEFCAGLGAECPEKGDREGWREVFNFLRALEQMGFVEVSRSGRDIDGLILTEAGANRVREKLDAKRGLLSMMGS